MALNIGKEITLRKRATVPEQRLDPRIPDHRAADQPP